MKWRLQIAALLAVILLFSLYSFRNKQAVIATPFTASSLPITYLDTHQSDLLKKIFSKSRSVSSHPTHRTAGDPCAEETLLTRSSIPKLRTLSREGIMSLCLAHPPSLERPHGAQSMWKHIKNPPDWQPDTTIDSISDIPPVGNTCARKPESISR